MPYKIHPELETPPDDTVIWRYLNFVKLMDLIEGRRLWFARVDTFEDPLEGTHTDAEVEFLRTQKVAISPGKDLTLDKQYVNATRMYRETMYVNCWRAARTESMAMWDIYWKDSGVVAIKSTVGRLKEVLDGYAYTAFIGRVIYVDWNEIAWNLNALKMVTRKDRSYEHELELRAIVWGLGVEGDPPIITGHSLDPDGRYVSEGPLGVEVACDPERLVTEIVIGPREQEIFHRLLGPILSRYGLTIPVCASDRLRARSPKA